VIKLKGKEAPSFVRRRLQGWGMSEVERLLRSLNSYTKHEDVIFELMDEAKLDVFKLEGYNAKQLSDIANGKSTTAMQAVMFNKNYHNAIVMDKEDDYEQKELTFSGLAEIMNQIRIGEAAAAGMPMTKLFGLSATGFNAGEEDLENYNAMVEGDVRHDAKTILYTILPLHARHCFGYAPEMIEPQFKSLRVLTSEQEETIKTQKYNRLQSQYKDGLMNDVEYCEALKKEGLMDMDTEVSRGLIEAQPRGFGAGIPQENEDGKTGR
jgi:hypothetical protein